MSLRLSFFGAARTVTGSCFLIEAGRVRILVDCGMFQGSKTLKSLNYQPFPFDPASLDAVLLTHAHIDHSGLLPKLCRAGYGGPIHMTGPTGDLLGCMLPDSGHIQESEVEQLNRRNQRRGRPPVTPIYTVADAEATLDQIARVPYGVWTMVAGGVRARWWNAGHLLGSASIEIEIDSEGGRPLRLLFSGDIGPGEKLLQQQPTAPSAFDHIVCEATYGDRDRSDPAPGARRRLLAEEVRAAQRRGGALLIPSFAVERTQELITDLVALMDDGTVPPAPIFVDSPLASRATAVFLRHRDDLVNGEALAHAVTSRHLRLVESVEASKALARIGGFHIIIAASGMCEAGRIRHHLKNWISRDDASVLFVGYQAQGTLGRILLDGADAVRIQGEEFRVNAAIRSIDLYSGHADGRELAAWVAERLPLAGALFLVHGEPEAIEGLRHRLGSRVLPPRRVLIPEMDDTFELTSNRAVRLPPDHARRIDPGKAARLDWHNDLSKLLLDVSRAVDQAADERSKQVVIRRLRRALEARAG